MVEEKAIEIRSFCEKNSDPEIIKKYSRYFKEGYNGYGLKKEVFDSQKDHWIKKWKDEMSLSSYLDLADILMKNGKLEEKSFAIVFVQFKRREFNADTFDRIGKWFDYGIDNWATTDVLCMLLLSSFFVDNVIPLSKLKEWEKANSEWQRRAIPVTLNELVKHNLDAKIAFNLIDSLMLDDSQYVQKGIGTLLRGLWKKEPGRVEDFLL